MFNIEYYNKRKIVETTTSKEKIVFSLTILLTLILIQATT